MIVKNSRFFKVLLKLIIIIRWSVKTYTLTSLSKKKVLSSDMLIYIEGSGMKYQFYM